MLAKLEMVGMRSMMAAERRRLEKNVHEEIDKEIFAGKVFGRDGETDPVWTDGGRVHACADEGPSGGVREQRRSGSRTW